MKNRIVISLPFALVLGAISSASASNWPGWRGPVGTGVSSEKNLPLTWTTNENVRWRMDLPGPGNSSPVVWDNRVFVAQFVQNENRRTLMCFDRTSGKLLWQSGVAYSDHEQTQEDNSYCSGTPATDGEHVYVCFGSAGVYAYDFNGKEVWHRDLGKLNHMFGNAISPVLYHDFCIFNYGPDPKARLIALNKKTGDTVWEAEPPKPDESERQQAPGGRNFGMGTFLGPMMLSQAHKNNDEKVSKEEFVAVADVWFEKLDPEKTGKVNQEQFVQKIGDVFPPPPGFAGRGGRPPGDEKRPPGKDRENGPGRFIGPGLFSAVDQDKDGTVTLPELKQTFAKWFESWDTNKSGTLDEGKLRDGLNSVLPRPNFGGGDRPGPGPGGPPGGPGGPERRGGPGGPGRPGGEGGPGGMDPSGSWSTPIVVKASGHDELVVNFPNRLVGIDPESGKQLWLSKGLGPTIYTTPLASDGTLVAMSSGMGTGIALAVKNGGSGDVTESQRLWRSDRVKNSIGSGVIYEGHLYTISAEGIVTCMDLKDGSKLWEERLQGASSRNSSWSSMIVADGKIYVPNQSGDVFVLRAAPKFEVLATNSVGEPTNASLAASNGELFLRTDKSLWCFAAKK